LTLQINIISPSACIPIFVFVFTVKSMQILLLRIKWESAVDRVDEAEVSWAGVVQVEAVEWETEEA
jgi:hypothetical protein